jgi:hypothetical protein
MDGPPVAMAFILAGSLLFCFLPVKPHSNDLSSHPANASKDGRVRRSRARKLAEHGLHARRQSHITLGRIDLENRFSKDLV